MQMVPDDCQRLPSGNPIVFLCFLDHPEDAKRDQKGIEKAYQTERMKGRNKERGKRKKRRFEDFKKEECALHALTVCVGGLQ